MANTLAHLAIAHNIIARRPALVSHVDSFYLGTIAPDSIESKAAAVRDDKKLVHLRLGITDMEWLEPDKMAIFDRRLEDFVQYFIYKEPDPAQRDFCIGYLVHLLTDKINHGTVRQRILKALIPHGFSDGNWDFVYKVLNELEALDFYLLESRPEIAALFHSITTAPITNYIPGMIEKEYLKKSQHWWREEYIPHIRQRKAEIMENREIDEFVELATGSILLSLDHFIK